MSLTVKEIVVKNIPSRNKLFLWIYFRGSNYRATEIVQPSKGSARFQPQNWTFSTVAENELLIFELYQEKWGKDKFIGKVHVILGKLQQSNNLQFHGNKFVVDKKKEIKFELDFELEYQLPYDAPSCLNEHASSQTVFLMENFDENNDESDLNVSLPFPEFEIAEDWKVRLRVHKGKELHGKDCRPFVTVQILDQKYNTNTCDSANPIWEEEFMFNFKTNKPKFLDSIVYIKVFSAKNLLPKKETIGNAKFDLWTIYKKAKHCIQQKWVVLQEVNTEEIKGYVLLSISIYQTKEPVQITLIEDTNLDSNLFLPIGFLAPREIYAYSITVYKAESVAAAKRDDLIDIFNTIIPGKGRINISDPYVKVEFGGESISTKVVKKSVDAVFNQVIEFRDFFPPMYKRIKVALIDKEGGVDSDEILATHFIDLSDISYYGEEIDWINADYGIDVEYPPTFGPCWINLYGSTTDFDKHKYMNQGFAQGNSFRGRLLIEINCNPLENVNISDIKVCKSLDNIKVGNMKRENFLLYATIYDASMIEEKHKGKEIFFEITIGSCGIHDLNQSSANTEISSSNRQVNNDQSMKSMLLGMESLEDKWPFTQPVKASLASSKKSCYLDLEKLKPCVFLEFNKEDDSFRLHLIIMLNKMYNMIDECLCVVQKSTENISLAAINKAAINFSGQVEYVLNYYKSLLNQNMVNKLDTLLAEKRKQTLEQLLKLFSELRVPEVVIAQKIDILTIIKRHVGKLIKDPQQSFPDVFIWMIADKKRIAYARVKAESILYSEDKFICAPYAGKLHSLFLQFYKYEKQQRSQRYIQAKIEIRLWLGCSTKKPVNYLVNAPKGYQLPEVLSTPYLRNLEYKSTEKFILHAHIYQGRTVFGSDEDGLSDPFARIMFANSMEETWVVPNTRVPLWDQSFVFDNVSLYGDESKIYSPVVLITLFDKDPNDKEEFLGQAIAVPKIVNSNYVPAKLELKPIFIGKRSVGDIIAAFELFPVGYKNLPELPEETYRLQAFSKEPVRCIPVPKNIRPALVSYRIELLFWGLRDLEKHSGLFGKSVQRPQVIADFSYNATLLNGESTRKLKSSICRNAVRNPNFENPVFIFDMDLPHNIDFMPECTISVIDHQRFSSNKTTQLFATHTTAPVDKFICNPDDFKKIYFEGYAPGTKVSLSSMPKKIPKEIMLNIEPVDNEEIIDWWTRFYASEKSTQKADEENDFPKITIYHHELEKEFDDFNDLFTSFPLVRGKQDKYKNEWDPRRIKGKFKGAIRLWKREKVMDCEQLKSSEGTFHYLPPKAPVKVCVRIYCIMAIGLTSKDIISGKSDPYVCVQFGKSKTGDPSKHIPNNLNPEFGEIYEVEGTIPFDTTLTIQVYDYDRGLVSNELIGQTQIDIENRYFTKYRAKCGLPTEYKKYGLTKWRDIQMPTEILNELGERRKISVNYLGLETDPEETAFAALKRFQKTDFKLVPEHVETRTLTHPDYPELSQGKLLMWADIFPSGKLPPPVDITKPKPMKYELRVIIWNCANVPCIDKSILLGNVPSSDIYIKGWLSGMPGKSQKTDVHYRSTDGSGMFNWRFIFPFDYYQPKRMFIFKKKLSPLSIDETEFYFPAQLILECREADVIGSRKFGRLKIDLLKLPPYYIKSSGWSLEAWEERLIDKKREEKKVSLFKNRTLKGWMPFMMPDENDLKRNIEQGRVEIELELVTEEEAKDRPVGMRREKPQALPKPDRPEENIRLFMNPFKMARLLWKSYRSILFKLILFLLLLLLVVLFIYALPGYLAKKSLGV